MDEVPTIPKKLSDYTQISELTPEEQQDLIDMYTSGNTAKVVSAKYNINPANLYSFLSSKGIKKNPNAMTGKGPKKKSQHSFVITVQNIRIGLDLGTGLSVDDVAISEDEIALKVN